MALAFYRLVVYSGTRAADGASVDCYLITHASLLAGTLVECEPIGLLEQDEDGELDHKVLAALPGQHIELGQDWCRNCETSSTRCRAVARHPRAGWTPAAASGSSATPSACRAA